MEIKLPLILDGSTGTQLQKYGYDGKTTAEEWCIAHPEAVQAFQKKYIESGSHVIYAPTFGANAPTLEKHKIFGKVGEFNQKLVAISKAVAGDKAYVAGDISPTGRYLYPLGDATFEELYEIYKEQAEALEEAGVDLFAVETMVSLADARAAILAIKSVSKKPVIVTFTCDESGKTMMGTDVVAALIVCQSMGIDAFGLNCSTGPDGMLTQLKRLSGHAYIPLIAKPNAGMPKIIDGKTVYSCSVEDFSAYVKEMASYGVALFGGCCGTDEGHIKGLSEKVAEISLNEAEDKKTTVLSCANGKNAFFLPMDIAVNTIISASGDLLEAFEEAEDKKGHLLCVEIKDIDGVQNLADAEYALTKALCIKCEDVTLLEQSLRIFQGRALYEGSLPGEDLISLAKKYGLIL